MKDSHPLQRQPRAGIGTLASSPTVSPSSSRQFASGMGRKNPGEPAQGNGKPLRWSIAQIPLTRGKPELPPEEGETSEADQLREHMLAPRPAAPPGSEIGTSGLPERLKAGLERLSHLSLDHVQVHYHSPHAARVQALAYTQGTQIHLGPGQERHLAHEAWHVVQQYQGRIQATGYIKGIAINDDERLESEAESMGHRAETLAPRQAQPTSPAHASNTAVSPTSPQVQFSRSPSTAPAGSVVVQRVVEKRGKNKWYSTVTGKTYKTKKEADQAEQAAKAFKHKPIASYFTSISPSQETSAPKKTGSQPVRTGDTPISPHLSICSDSIRGIQAQAAESSTIATCADTCAWTHVLVHILVALIAICSPS